MHRFLRRLGKTLAALLAVLLAYLLAAFTLGSIVLTPERHGRRDIILYLLDNGVQTSPCRLPTTPTTGRRSSALKTPAIPLSPPLTSHSVGATAPSTSKRRTGAT